MQIPLLGRALAIAGVALALLVPIALIEGKIAERRNRAEGVVAQFAFENTGPQVVAGPFLALTCEESYVEEREIKRGGKAETISEQKLRACPTGYFPPRTLKVAAKMPVENRHRGIYQIRTYLASIEMSGELDWPAPATSTGTDSRVWKKAYLVTAVSDPRGIKVARSATSQALKRSIDPGVDRSFAIVEDLGEHSSRRAGAPVAFSYHLDLAGTSSFHFAPAGDATEIRIASDWPHPSFSGGWSPDERVIDAAGFQATWRTTHLATGGQAFWEKQAREGKLVMAAGGAGVSLFQPVNVYSLSYRATEYGFLFILFTFTALALVEVLVGIRLHPIQYALVGSAIAVFFLLLIAMSEHIQFSHAYIAASGACVVLIAIYLRHPLGTSARTAAVAALFISLYAGLYVLLSSEDHALLMGSAMVFVLLSIVMIATRKMDWSEMARRMARPKPAPAPAPVAAG